MIGVYDPCPGKAEKGEMKINALSMRTARGILALALMCLSANAAMAQTTIARIVSAANTFLSTLDQTQRQSVLFAFDDEKQRARWSNLPITIVPRAGLSLRAMNPAQRAAAMALVSSALSPRGFEKVQQIMDGDELLKIDEKSERMFGKDRYYVSILGTPSEKEHWMLQFGGHHLALNISFAGERGVLTPTLTAAQPALYTLNGKTVRPLGQESDKGLALLNSLGENQRKQAILPFRVADLVLGPGQDGKTIQPEGLKASAMNEPQRAMLLDLVAEWSGIIHHSAATARRVDIKADINDTWFAWSGPTTVAPGHNITAYYRIQGPRLVIEYSPQPLGGVRRCMSIPSVAIQPTTTVENPSQNESGAGCRRRDVVAGRNACRRAQAG